MVHDFFKKEELEPVLKGLERLVDIQAERLYKAGKIKGTLIMRCYRYIIIFHASQSSLVEFIVYVLMAIITVISETGYPDIHGTALTNGQIMPVCTDRHIRQLTEYDFDISCYNSHIKRGI